LSGAQSNLVSPVGCATGKTISIYSQETTTLSAIKMGKIGGIGRIFATPLDIGHTDLV